MSHCEASRCLTMQRAPTCQSEGRPVLKPVLKHTPRYSTFFTLIKSFFVLFAAFGLLCCEPQDGATVCESKTLRKWVSVIKAQLLNDVYVWKSIQNSFDEGLACVRPSGSSTVCSTLTCPQTCRPSCPGSHTRSVSSTLVVPTIRLDKRSSVFTLTLLHHPSSMSKYALMKVYKSAALLLYVCAN